MGRAYDWILSRLDQKVEEKKRSVTKLRWEKAQLEKQLEEIKRKKAAEAPEEKEHE